jgi:hypothetical protein
MPRLPEKFFLNALLVIAILACARIAAAQGNYEIQVYGADTVAPRTLMTELHSNYTVDGQKYYVDGVIPTNHQEHETLELTEGLTNWSELGFYVFTSEQDGHGVQWVGDHIRPRVRAPDSWHLPVGLSLSTEIGYQRAVYSPDTWTWEIRPIIDKTMGRWYLAINPALERTLHGPDVNQGLGFSPGAKVSYDFTRVISGGFNTSPKWEINFGVGLGPTAATDHLIVKGIIGRRFDWGRHSAVE